jgi:hypothetical protein
VLRPPAGKGEERERKLTVRGEDKEQRAMRRLERRTYGADANGSVKVLIQDLVALFERKGRRGNHHKERSERVHSSGGSLLVRGETPA